MRIEVIINNIKHEKFFSIKFEKIKILKNIEISIYY
mgnify:CR=1